MNEVRLNQSMLASSVAASSTGAESVKPKQIEGGKALPAVEKKDENSSETPAVAAQKLQQVVAQMNDFVQQERRDLFFSVDEVTGSTVIRVMDSENGDLIRQIPNEMFLEMAERVQSMQAVNLINTYG